MSREVHVRFCERPRGRLLRSTRFVVLTKSKKKANRALEVIKEIVEGQLNLRLHPEKTVVTNFGKGFTFLGYEFKYWQYKRPRRKALKRFKDKVREVTRRQ